MSTLLEEYLIRRYLEEVATMIGTEHQWCCNRYEPHNDCQSAQYKNDLIE